MEETDVCAAGDSSLKSGSPSPEEITIKLESERLKISGTQRSSTQDSW